MIEILFHKPPIEVGTVVGVGHTVSKVVHITEGGLCQMQSPFLPDQMWSSSQVRSMQVVNRWTIRLTINGLRAEFEDLHSAGVWASDRLDDMEQAVLFGIDLAVAWEGRKR